MTRNKGKDTHKCVIVYFCLNLTNGRSFHVKWGKSEYAFVRSYTPVGLTIKASFHPAIYDEIRIHRYIIETRLPLNTTYPVFERCI